MKNGLFKEKKLLEILEGFAVLFSIFGVSHETDEFSFVIKNFQIHIRKKLKKKTI